MRIRTIGKNTAVRIETVKGLKKQDAIWWTGFIWLSIKMSDELYGKDPIHSRKCSEFLN